MEYYRDNFGLREFKSSINIRLVHETDMNREDLVEFDIELSSDRVRYLHPAISITHIEHIVEYINLDMSFKDLINILLELILEDVPEDYSDVQYCRVPRFDWRLFYDSGEHWSFVLWMLESGDMELVSWIDASEGSICMSVNRLDLDSTIRQVLEQSSINMSSL